MKYFYEIYEKMPRQGPGGNEYTRRALSLLPGLPREPKVLDIGCGSGAQTLVLARELGGKICAVDNHGPFLDTLKTKAQRAGLSGVITTQLASMFQLPFESESFDLVWSEGAIYIIGFEKGLREWARLIKPGGFIAVTEISWLTQERPREVADYWQEYYPGMNDVEGNLALAENCGYQVLGHFALPKKAWEENYYAPHDEVLAEMEARYSDSPEALSVCRETRREIEMYRRFGEYYGYVFYLLKKP